MPQAAGAARPAYHHGDLYRALLDAARALMAEQQSWDFSLREVARRAGVSHNAPYNHFADKRELLAALAAEGFDRLTARTEAAAAGIAAPDAALLAIGLAYARFGLENPAHYRLMFGAGAKSYACLPEAVATAGAAAKAVLRRAICRGAEAGLFAPAPADPAAIEIAVLAAWAGVHGLTMLFIDGLPGEAAAGQLPERVIAAALRRQFEGLLRRSP